MIRILHSVSNMDRAGIETMLMNYYRNIDRDKVQFDFIVNKSKPGDYDEEILSLGGRIFKSPGLSPIKYPAYLKFVDEIVKNNPSIKVIHAHNEAMGLYALKGAQKAGVPVRIAHAHNTKIIRDYKWPLKIFCKQFLPYAATDYFSCGRDAGIYYFGKKRWESKGRIINNAIDLDKFKFNEEKRGKIRKEFDLDDKLVIGHIGRFNLQKNHTRLLEIFSAVSKKSDKAVLVLIGEGELEQEMKIKAESLKIQDKVRFLGLRSNVNEWYQAMDLFIMPSLFEGLPVVGIEAQAAGLPCIFSSAVTDEIMLLDTTKRISLEDSDEVWSDNIIKALKAPVNRVFGEEVIRKAGYDIKTEAKKLQDLYCEMSKR